MNMIRLPRVLSLLIILLFASMSSNAADKRPLWELELTLSPYYGQVDLSTANSDMNRFLDISENFANSNGLTFSKNSHDEFANAFTYDIKLGVRYWHIIGGITFAKLPELQGGFDTQYDYLSTTFGTTSYKLSLVSREYLFYLGYMQPITSIIDIGLIGSIGPSSMEGTQSLDEVSFGFGGISEDNSITTFKDEYIAKRVEGRLRVHVRWNIAIDLGVGYRWSDAGMVRGDFTDNYNVPHLNETVKLLSADHYLPLDVSGIFYGGGITLKNPLGRE